MKAVKLGLLAIGLCASIGRIAAAANYSISAEITAAYDADFNPLPSVPNVSMNLGAPHIFSINFTLHASGFNSAANQRGFGNLAFNINLSGNSLAALGQFGWFAINPIVDTNGPASGGMFPLWFTNEDLGNPGDLKDILLDIQVIPSPHVADPRPRVGEQPGTLAGAVFVYWDGIGPETLGVTGVTLGEALQASFTRIDNGQMELDTAAVFSGATITFGVAPSIGDFDGDGDVDGADFVVWQTHFPMASGATLADGDADFDGDVDGADFVIWQTHFPTAGSPAVAPVPEPAAWMLLAIGGLSVLITLRRDDAAGEGDQYRSIRLSVTGTASSRGG